MTHQRVQRGSGDRAHAALWMMREWRQSTRSTVDDEGEESAAPYDTRMVWYSPEGIRCERANSLQTVQRADAKEDE